MKRIFLLLLFTINSSLFIVKAQQGEWTWMNGDNIPNSIGHYGTQGVFDPANTPPVNNEGIGGIGNERKTSVTIGINYLHPAVNSPIQVTPSFTADTFQGCTPLTIHFTNNSINGTSYLWNFGDGDTSTAINPVHTYSDSGTFTVTLTAVNDTSPCGRYSNTITQTDYVKTGSPIYLRASFTASTDYGCAPLVVDFTNTSLNATEYYWALGNGQVDSIASPKHVVYPDTGTFQVLLIAYNQNPLCPNSPDIRTLDITVGDCELYFPNIITPNGDQLNDLFQFVARGYTNCNLTIFNRWGMQVYTSPLTDSFWDGTINFTSAEVVDGVYYYIFTATDFYGKPFAQKGFVEVIR